MGRCVVMYARGRPNRRLTWEGKKRCILLLRICVHIIQERMKWFFIFHIPCGGVAVFTLVFYLTTFPAHALGALGEVSSAPRQRPLRSVWMESAGALSFVGLHRLPQNFINRLPNRGRGRIAIILLVTNRERFYLNCLGFFS